MKIFLINLDRDTDRLETVKQRLDAAGVLFERVSAVYGKDLSQCEKDRAVNRLRFRMSMGRDVFDGEIGCALSHAKIYQKMIDDNISIACIFEDDVIFNGPIRERIDEVEKFLDPMKSQVVLFSDYLEVPRTRGIHRIKSGWATDSYALTLPAARALLQVNSPMKCACDHWQRWVRLRAIELYGSFPAVTNQAWDLFESHIKPRTVVRHGICWRTMVWGVKRIDRLIQSFECYSPIEYNYCKDPPKGYSANANAVQKVRLVQDYLNRGVPINVRKKIVHCIAGSVEKDFISAIFRHIFLRHRIVLFCWDPPGIYWRDRKDLLARIRVWVLSQLQSMAIMCSKCTIFNLHRGFAERYLWKCALRKCAFFPNGTCVADNQKMADGVKHIPHRIAISNAFMAGKGCYWLAGRLVEVKRQIPDLSVVWVGADHGDLTAVREQLLSGGFSTSDLVHLGPAKHADALRLWASADIGFNAYPDQPSVRWNYVLKIPEFMSLGLPIVSVDLPGAHEYITPDVGVLFAPNDAAGAVRALCGIVSDGNQLVTYRAAALVRVKEFNWSKINKEIAKTIKQKCEV